MNAPLWSTLEAEARHATSGAGPGHDFAHVLRVVENAWVIALAEGADLETVRAAALLHELFNYPKDHPDSHRSGDVCAERADALLERVGFDPDKRRVAVSAIRDHAFSKRVSPESLEARVLQDADRLDAIGAIGVARWAATCADMKRPFYHPEDPFCREHVVDDKRWGLDHFYRKLLRIPETLHTRTARRMAERRVAFLRRFLEELADEMGTA